MDVKVPPRDDQSWHGEREQRLKTFILDGLQHCGIGRGDAVMVFARSPESIVARAVFALSGEMVARTLGARLVWTRPPVVGRGEGSQAVWVPGFACEMRLASNPRYLDGHEQLIIGDRALWYGDCMRRDPDKRDAFSSFVADDAGQVGVARRTFDRLWTSATPIVMPQHDVQPAVAAGSPAIPVEQIAAADAGTLEVWQPSRRH